MSDERTAVGEGAMATPPWVATTSAARSRWTRTLGLGSRSTTRISARTATARS